MGAATLTISASCCPHVLSGIPVYLDVSRKVFCPEITATSELETFVESNKIPLVYSASAPDVYGYDKELCAGSVGIRMISMNVLTQWENPFPVRAFCYPLGVICGERSLIYCDGSIMMNLQEFATIL